MISGDTGSAARKRAARIDRALCNSSVRLKLARRLERFWAGDGRNRAGEDKINACRLEPVSVFVEVRVDAGGANDGIGRFERNVFGVFENAFENAAEFPTSPGKEAGAMCVPIDRGAIGDLVLSRDQLWAAPTDEVAFDRVAIGVEADAAAAGVAGEIGRHAGGRGSRGGYNEVEELTAEVGEIEVVEELGSGDGGTKPELQVAGPGVLGTGSAEIPPGAGVIAAALFSIGGAA